MTVALVDCNNFYASCEQAFDPSIAGRPVIVLSNNDGCIVARSSEAKALGFPMAAAAFKLKDEIRRHRVVVRSSNYALYGDMSARVAAILSEFTPRREIYSIDECFLDFSGDRRDLAALGTEIRETVIRNTGIPVSVGYGPTKTLAKLANKIAKKSPDAAGVFDLSDLETRRSALESTELTDIWGIGSRRAAALASHSIHTAADLAGVQDAWARRVLALPGLRTVHELRGVPCIDLETIPPPKQTICVSRSFGRPMVDLEELKHAISTFTDMAGVKLRKGGLAAGRLTVFIESDGFRPDLPQHNASCGFDLTAAAYTVQRLQANALAGIDRIYRPGIGYKRAGVLLLDLAQADSVPGDLFETESPRAIEISDLCDRLNSRFGHETLTVGRIKKSKTWYMRQESRSPAYTTRWSDIPTAYCR